MSRPGHFIAALLGALLLAFIYPDAAAKGGWLKTEITGEIGVVLIFALMGLSLKPAELLSGLKPLRVHVAVLAWNFALYPILAAGVIALCGPSLNPSLKCGFALLSLLPTTIASSVAFTAMSGGNAATAVFSTVFSNLVAVVAVPLLGAAYLKSQQGVEIALLPVFIKIGLVVVLPLTAGQVTRRLCPAWASALAPHSRNISSWIILYLIHSVFATAVRSGFMGQVSPLELALVTANALLLLALSHAASWYSLRLTGVPRPVRIAAFYAAAQKSLATGLPLLTPLLSDIPLSSALIVMPIMIYHPAQLILASLLAPRFASPSSPAAAPA